MRLSLSLHRFSLLLGLAFLTACADAQLPEGPPPDMGDFRLGHFAVGADDAQKATGSRKAEPQEWTSALEQEIRARLEQHDGDAFYHLSVRVDGYLLAPPGVPILFSPRSFLVVTVNVWDDSTQSKLNDEPKQIVVLEGTSAETFIGSGLTQNKTRQIEKLSRNAAKEVQDWLLSHPEWFGIEASELNRTQTAPETAELASSS